MFSPFTNFESLTDEQLLEKKLELSKKCATITNGNIRSQINGMIAEITLIMSDRQQIKPTEETDEFDDSLSIG